MKPIVYILDDETAFIYLMEHVLKKLGLDIVTFSKKEDFLQRMKERLPQLCLIDLNLATPLAGFEIIETVRQFISSSVPMIVISSDSEAASVAHSLDLGANDYLFKPLDRQILIAKVSNFVSSPELESNLLNPAAILENKIPAQLSVDAKITQIEETGLVLSSPHLITKGTVTQLTGALVNEILGKEGYILATTVATSIDEENVFSAYLEFDSSQPNIPNLVRTWILKKNPSATSP